MANTLVAEDEEVLREILIDHLVDERHSVVGARNGKEALGLYPTVKPDLIISDINMPVMDGYQFLKSLQETYPEIEDTPFFFLTALADREHQIKGLELHALRIGAIAISYEHAVAMGTRILPR